MILVAGATGRLGGAIARELLARGQQVRALVRPGSNTGPLAEVGAQLSWGDLRDRASLDAACQDVSTVITTAIPRPTAGPDEVAAVNLIGNRNLIDAAQAAGVEHFIFTAGYGADPNSPVPFIAAKGQTEVYLRNCGMPYTILEPEMLMDTLVMLLVGRPALQGEPVWVQGAGDDRHALVAVQDVARLAAAVALGGPSARNRTIVIGGPEAVSLRDIADAFERILGCPVTVRSYPPGQPPAGLSPIVAGLLATIPNFAAAPDGNAVAAEFGITLTSVEAFARQALQARQTSS